mmetsp:Transcript_5743/g.6591  ORF Transcript_5743/g.6591 Transcript_5743/m.6591 type:complete len:230 (+) Transcript_5743:89-778(+)|eukprot:CAMPEP_0197855180 /NCGR_PEP_ID=MMETSP1438-20131217/26120_1 /TAXON_ID=1461541 /ORGANISM="Pterosperma sp., Strain CCMP1384" /LENGTH=229 /DNA_ID=CAMNT_0043470187 /DNA_START=79 /DNA_END=768 /DNA_ORIENTATION=-
MTLASVTTQLKLPIRTSFGSSARISRASQVARSAPVKSRSTGLGGSCRSVRSERTFSSGRRVVLSRASRPSIVCEAAAEDVGEVEEEEEEGRPDFTFYFSMPSKGIKDNGIADVKIKPILEDSELVIARYDIPFGLNAAPDKASGQVVVGRDGDFPQVEKKGDILRQATYWPSPKAPALLDISQNVDKWDLVVQALQTNTDDVTEDIVLVFERPNLTKRIFSNVEENVE